jgi:hypothetical protein
MNYIALGGPRIGKSTLLNHLLTDSPKLFPTDIITNVNHISAIEHNGTTFIDTPAWTLKNSNRMLELIQSKMVPGNEYIVFFIIRDFNGIPNGMDIEIMNSMLDRMPCSKLYYGVVVNQIHSIKSKDVYKSLVNAGKHKTDFIYFEDYQLNWTPSKGLLEFLLSIPVNVLLESFEHINTLSPLEELEMELEDVKQQNMALIDAVDLLEQKLDATEKDYQKSSKIVIHGWFEQWGTKHITSFRVDEPLEKGKAFHGKGRDKVGSYVVQGEMAHHFMMVKQYDPHNVHYVGQVDYQERCIIGTWRLSFHDSGSFYFHF